jgi:hypothetical protein
MLLPKLSIILMNYKMGKNPFNHLKGYGDGAIMPITMPF